MKRGNENEALARIGYNKERDAYELFTSVDGGENWGLVVSCACVRRAGEKADTEPEYVHMTLIEELKNAIRYGYSVVY